MKRRGFFMALIILSSISLLCSCWGYGEVYYGYPPDYPPPPDYVTPPEYNLFGTYWLLGFDVDYYDYYTLDYLYSTSEGDVGSYSGELRIGYYSMSQTIVIEGDYFVQSDYYDVIYTYGTSEGIFDYENDDDALFFCSGDVLTIVLSFCSQPLGLCWDEIYYWEKVSDRLSVDQPGPADQVGVETAPGRLGGVLAR